MNNYAWQEHARTGRTKTRSGEAIQWCYILTLSCLVPCLACNSLGRGEVTASPARTKELTLGPRLFVKHHRACHPRASPPSQVKHAITLAKGYHRRPQKHHPSQRPGTPAPTLPAPKRRDRALRFALTELANQESYRSHANYQQTHIPLPQTTVEYHCRIPLSDAIHRTTINGTITAI
jgi:hypothetical protein